MVRFAGGGRGGVSERTFDVVFVCTGNTCRSPMAAGLFARMLAQGALQGAGALEANAVRISSAGVGAAPGQPASPLAIAACDPRGVDLRDHRSRPLTEEILARADLVLVMEAHHRDAITAHHPAARDKVHLLSELAGDAGGRGVADPFLGDARRYAETCETLARLLRAAWPRLLERITRRDAG